MKRTQNTTANFFSSEKDLEKPIIKTCTENLNLNLADKDNLYGNRFR